MSVRELNKQHFLTKLAGVGLNIHGYHRPHAVEGGDPDDAWDYRHESRVKTPFDKETSQLYKAPGFVLTEKDMIPDQKAVYDLTSDDVYGETPLDVRLDKAQLAKLHELYSTKGVAGLRPEEKGALDPFLNKLKHLQQDPTMQYARLEWE